MGDGPQLTHIDARGEAHMVDVGDKAETTRTAIAEGTVTMLPETLASLDELRVYLDIFVERDDGNTATVDFVKVVLAAECSITKMYRRRL